jgi:hypothetical protein
MIRTGFDGNDCPIEAKLKHAKNIVKTAFNFKLFI